MRKSPTDKSEMLLRRFYEYNTGPGRELIRYVVSVAERSWILDCGVLALLAIQKFETLVLAMTVVSSAILGKARAPVCSVVLARFSIFVSCVLVVLTKGIFELCSRWDTCRASCLVALYHPASTL